MKLFETKRNEETMFDYSSSINREQFQYFCEVVQHEDACEDSRHRNGLIPKNNEELTCVTQIRLVVITANVLDDTQYETYHAFGDMQVAFTKADMGEIKTIDEPSLRVMGFKDISRLKAYHQIKPSYFIYPDEQYVTGSRQAFKALMTACHLENYMAICRFTSRKGTIPRMVALVPQLEILEEGGSQTQPPRVQPTFPSLCG
eukprot:TRINITY_DN433_c0_g1_i1.p1 TRINITY_DN433_c0_g1~~TRINITY_DN433_c0_g1_i1.p1  ORF type:complete len:202 (-),score=27.68 TRINITY_DN433_c0_g1_i1:459-1064(-)